MVELPAVPKKKFLEFGTQSASASSSDEDSNGVIKKKQLQARLVEDLPQLPARPSTRSTKFKTEMAYARDDCVCTSIEANSTWNVDFAAALTKISARSTRSTLEFVVRAVLKDNLVLGLTGGILFGVELETNRFLMFSDSQNRNISSIHQVNPDTILVFQDTGTVLKVKFGAAPTWKIVLKGSGLGAGTPIARPGTDELWLVGARGTNVMLINGDQEVALLKTIPTHFIASQMTFLSATELAVICAAKQKLEIYSLARNNHQPAKFISLQMSSEFGQIIKVFKGEFGYAAVHTDGRIVIWRVVDGEIVQRTVFPITLYKIMSVFYENSKLWIGLNTGKLQVFRFDSFDSIVLIAEMKVHDAPIQSRSFVNAEFIYFTDGSARISAWDRKLKRLTVNEELWRRESEFCAFETIHIRICTWNVASQKVNDPQTLDKLAGLEADSNAALIVIGLQEIVDLESKAMSARSFLGQNGGPGSSSAVLEEWTRALQARLRGYRLIHAASMVGLGLIVFCRESNLSDVTLPSETSVKTGLGGMHGNKGGLCWRGFIHDTPVAFICAHLAAGQKAVTDRNSDVSTILRTARLSEVKKDSFAFKTGNNGTKLLDNTCTFLFGDLNYRVEMDRSACEQLLSSGALDQLKSVDQLRNQMSRNDWLLTYFKEAEIGFKPTYKYDLGTLDTFDSSEKQRTPAWCDRILFHSHQSDLVQCLNYNSIAETTVSDHKPVYACFNVKCKRIDQRARARVLTSLLDADDLISLLNLK